MIQNFLAVIKNEQDAIFLFFWGYLLVLPFGLVNCFFNKYEIREDNRLYIYRPSQYCFLLKFKLFKDNNKFNYFLLAQLFISFIVFAVETIFFVLYLFKVEIAVYFIKSGILFAVSAVFCLADMIYTIVLEIVVSNNYIYDKEELKAYKKKIAEKRKKDELKYLAKLERKARRQKDKNKH